MERDCPVKTCTTTTPSDKHMCRHHWFMVPLHLRTAVWSAYNSWKNIVGSRTRTVEKVAAAAEKLRKAQEAATKSVDEQLLGKTAA